MVIQTRLTLHQVMVALMLNGYRAHLETQVLFDEAKKEFLKETTQQFIIQLADAPKTKHNLINAGFCSVCYNKFANLYLTEHLILIQKYKA